MSGLEGFAGPPLVAGSIRGVRYFHVGDGGNLLSTTHSRHHWDAGILQAKCLATTLVLVEEPDGYTHFKMQPAPPHEAPQMGCECGFYAYHKIPSAKEMVRSGVFPLMGMRIPDLEIVGGIIEAHGRVIVGSKGFRAEKAQILALFPQKSVTVESLRWLALPDVQLFHTAQEALEAFPLKPEEIAS